MSTGGGGGGEHNQYSCVAVYVRVAVVVVTCPPTSPQCNYTLAPGQGKVIVI